MSVFGSLSSSFARGALQGAGRLAGMYAAGDAAKPNFNELYARTINATKAGLELKDLQNLMQTLNEIEPNLKKQFIKDAKKLGVPARNAVQKGFKGLNVGGPLGQPKRPGRQFDKMKTNGRLAWAGSRSKRGVIDVNYKGRTPASFNRIKKAEDNTLSVIRIRVRGAAYVLADMAGRSNKKRLLTGQESRSYQINLFGRGVVTRTHKVNFENVSNWMSQLDRTSSQKKPSRYAYPALEKHTREFQANLETLVNKVIADTNRRMQG